MDHLGRTLDNLHRGDTQIIDGDLKVGGDHIITGDLEAKQIETGQLNPLAPATEIIINADLDTQNNKLLSSTNPTGVIIQGADFEAKTDINRVVNIDLRGNLTNLDTGFPQLLNPTLAGSTLYGGGDIKTAQLSYVSGTGDISVIDNLNLNGNQIKNIYSISNDNDGEVLVEGEDGGGGVLFSGEMNSSIPISINTNGKSSIIDNDSNTFDASSANLFNVNTGGTHSFTINNAQKFDIEPFVNTSRNPLKLLNEPLQFDITASIETFNTSVLSIDLEGEGLSIRADAITDDAMEFEGTLGNFSFNKNLKAPSIQALTGNLIVNSNLDMNSNELLNCPAVKSNGDLSLENATGIAEGIYIEDGGEILIKQDTSFENFNVRSVNNLQTKSVNDVKYIYQAADLPNPITSGEYHIMGDIVLTTSYNINAGANVSIRGTGRSKTKLRWTAITGLEALTIVDSNVDIANLSLESPTGSLIAYRNIAKDKVFSMTDCEITNVNGNPLNVEGGDLIDLLQVLCWYNFGNASSNFINVSKLQITSCEFLRYFERGSAPLNWATGNMIALSGNHGATNITSNLMHPQQTQNGIFLQDGATIYSALASAIVANTFIDIGLTTGVVYKYGGANTIDDYPFLITSNNIGYENETALAEMRLEGNILDTAIAMANTPYGINGGTAWTFPLTKRVSTTNTGTITYTAKNPTYFSITASFKLTVVAGGNNQNIEVGLLVNGVAVATCKQIIELDLNVFQNTSLNCLGFASQNDIYQLYVQNNTGANDVLVSDVVFTGFQI